MRWWDRKSVYRALRGSCNCDQACRKLLGEGDDQGTNTTMEENSCCFAELLIEDRLVYPTTKDVEVMNVAYRYSSDDSAATVQELWIGKDPAEDDLVPMCRRRVERMSAIGKHTVAELKASKTVPETRILRIGSAYNEGSVLHSSFKSASSSLIGAKTAAALGLPQLRQAALRSHGVEAVSATGSAVAVTKYVKCLERMFESSSVPGMPRIYYDVIPEVPTSWAEVECSQTQSSTPQGLAKERALMLRLSASSRQELEESQASRISSPKCSWLRWCRRSSFQRVLLGSSSQVQPFYRTAYPKVSDSLLTAANDRRIQGASETVKSFPQKAAPIVECSRALLGISEVCACNGVDWDEAPSLPMMFVGNPLWTEASAVFKELQEWNFSYWKW